MQLTVRIRPEAPLTLPVNYNHIVQSIIYRGIGAMEDYADFIHDTGYENGKRQYKLFQFSKLTGRYSVEGKRITFGQDVSFEIRSIDPMFLRLLGESFWRYGILFGNVLCRDIELELTDYTVEDSVIDIRMKSPITVYSTDLDEKHVTYFDPYEEEFYELINDNFHRKYQAYYGLEPESDIELRLADGANPRKLVTKYRQIYITAWDGRYILSGERKYLDFLYQTGLGSKNSQGFGMFEVI